VQCRFCGNETETLCTIHSEQLHCFSEYEGCRSCHAVFELHMDAKGEITHSSFYPFDYPVVVATVAYIKGDRGKVEKPTHEREKPKQRP
jgi:hypothetical protein